MNLRALFAAFITLMAISGSALAQFRIQDFPIRFTSPSGDSPEILRIRCTDGRRSDQWFTFRKNRIDRIEIFDHGDGIRSVTIKNSSGVALATYALTHNQFEGLQLYYRTMNSRIYTDSPCPIDFMISRKTGRIVEIRSVCDIAD